MRFANSAWIAGKFRRTGKRRSCLLDGVSAAFLFGDRTQMEKKKLDVSQQVESLINKAEKAEKSDDALKFSQAACNAANAANAGNAAWLDK